MKDWRHLKGRRVTVRAAGTVYRGTIVELGETSLVLRAEAGFREVPWDRILRIDDEGPGAPSGADRPRGPLPPGWGE